MKSIYTFLVASLFTAAVWARPEVPPQMQAVDAFHADASVQMQVQVLARRGFELSKAPAQAVLVGGGCGFAGCDTEYLVVKLLNSRGANTQTVSVIARVWVSALGGAKVRLAELM